MRRLSLLLLLLPTPLAAGDKADSFTLTKEEKTFFIPANFSPIRTVRLKFHPKHPLLLAQVTDRRLAIFDLTAPIPDKAPKGAKEKQIVPTMHCEQSTGWITSFDLEADGDKLVTGGSDRMLRLWSIEAGKPSAKPLKEIKAHDGWIEGAAWSPDGACIATAGSDNLVKTWKADDLSPLATFTGHARIVRDLVWADAGKTLISGDEGGKVLVWDVSTGRVVRTLEFGNDNLQQGQDPAHSGVARLALSPDGKWLVVAGHQKATVFGMEKGEPVASERLHFDVAFHPKGTILLGGQDDTKFLRLDAVKLGAASPLKSKGKGGPLGSIPGETFATLKRGGYGLAIHPDGTRLAAATAESTVGLWRIDKK